MKKHTNGYFDLLDLLNNYPEFTSLEDNPCDVVITSFGKNIWEQWAQTETANMSELDRQIEQKYYRSLYKNKRKEAKRVAEPEVETEKIRIEFNTSKKNSGNSALGQKINYNYSHLRYAIEGTETLRQAASMLGIHLPQLRKLIIEFGLDKEVAV